MQSEDLVAAVAVALVLASVAFAVDVREASTPGPVPFGDTVETGMTGVDVIEADQAGYAVPRAQAFYAQLRYVVGYYGVASLLDDVAGDRSGRFGTPVAVYVSDFTTVDVELDDGYLAAASGRAPRWIAATDAVYVVGSGARTPAGDAVVPFGDREAAETFAAEHGGDVVGWDVLPDRVAERNDPELRAATAERRAWADATSARAHRLLDRRVSTVVGRDAATVAAAVTAAPNGTAVRVPAGTYQVGNLTIDRPVTLRGAGDGTRLVGDGEGSVVRVRAPRVAVADLAVAGVGDTRTVAQLPEGERGGWDEPIRRSYGYGDAAVALHGANGSLVADVTADTPANGVAVRYSPGAVVDGVTVAGTEEWAEGFMGVVAMASRIVVQNASFRGGRDGVYTHRAHGIVVRDSTMRDMRFGVHEMYTSDGLVTGNVMRDTDVGAIVMTRPRGNHVVGNDVAGSDAGTVVEGAANRIANNSFHGNSYGMYVSSSRSVYRGNRLRDNDVGIRAGTPLPTNEVTANDVVDNDRYALALLGPLRVWRGNHWSDAPGWDGDGDGTIERALLATSPIDDAAGDGTGTLAVSPAARLVRALRSAVPGLRPTGVLDPAPRAAPVAGPAGRRAGR